MFIKLLLKIILGYVRIEVEGYYIERFINLCTNKKIFTWNLKRKNGVKLFPNIGINDFKKISDIAKKSKCKIKIKEKKGLPFLLHRYKKRKIFAILLLIVLILLFVSSRYVWNIEIIFQDNQFVENIEKDLENLGLKPGIPKNKIDSDKIINYIRLNRTDVAWIRNRYRGNKH